MGAWPRARLWSSRLRLRPAACRSSTSASSQPSLSTSTKATPAPLVSMMKRFCSSAAVDGGLRASPRRSATSTSETAHGGRVGRGSVRRAPQAPGDAASSEAPAARAASARLGLGLELLRDVELLLRLLGAAEPAAGACAEQVVRRLVVRDRSRRRAAACLRPSPRSPFVMIGLAQQDVGPAEVRVEPDRPSAGPRWPRPIGAARV